MESTFFQKVELEDTIEIKCNSDIVIEKLLEYNNYDSKYQLKYDKCDNTTYFVKKIGSKKRQMVYYTSGEVIPLQGKTIIKIYSVYDKFRDFIYYVPLALSIILFIIEILFSDFNISSKHKGFFIILLPLSIGLFIYNVFNTKRNKNNVLFYQRLELLNRIKTIKEQFD